MNLRRMSKRRRMSIRRRMSMRMMAKNLGRLAREMWYILQLKM